MSPILIPAGNPGAMTGPGNNTWLLMGAEPTLIDAGVGKPEHVDAIARALDGRPLARVLVTHGHPDHASGVPALRARWPLLEACKMRSLDDEPGFRGLHDRERVHAGDGSLEVIHTPGHAPDHLCFFDAGARHLFAGDMVTPGTTVMIPAGRGGNLRQYLSSLERLAALRPSRIYPGHGPIVERPLDLIAEYLEHRRLRERQVQACLDRGIVDVDAMVRDIYPDLAEGLRPAARLTVQAHLEKLREDGE